MWPRICCICIRITASLILVEKPIIAKLVHYATQNIQAGSCLYALLRELDLRERLYLCLIQKMSACISEIR